MNTRTNSPSIMRTPSVILVKSDKWTHSTLHTMQYIHYTAIYTLYSAYCALCCYSMTDVRRWLHNTIISEKYNQYSLFWCYYKLFTKVVVKWHQVTGFFSEMHTNGMSTAAVSREQNTPLATPSHLCHVTLKPHHMPPWMPLFLMVLPIYGGMVEEIHHNLFLALNVKQTHLRTDGS